MREFPVENSYGLDYGGTLIKIAHLKHVNSDASDFFNNFEFITFSSLDLKSALGYILKDSKLKSFNQVKIFATGGGSYKYKTDIYEYFLLELNVELVFVEEIHSLGLGLKVLNRYGISSLLNSKKSILYANIGTGVSIIHLDNDGNALRIGGTGIGGGTFYGLYSLFSNLMEPGTLQASFQDAVACANIDPSHLHLTVGDIYGDYCTIPKLEKSTIAGFFSACSSGKISLTLNDIAGGLLQLVSYAVISTLSEHYSQTKPDIIIIGGSFVGVNRKIVEFMRWVIEFKKIPAEFYFPEFGAYIGTIGAMYNNSDNSDK